LAPATIEISTRRAATPFTHGAGNAHRYQLTLSSQYNDVSLYSAPTDRPGGHQPYLYPTLAVMSCLSPSDSISHHPHHRHSFANSSHSFDTRLTHSLPPFPFSVKFCLVSQQQATSIKMKFSLIIAAAAGAIASPLAARHLPSVSAPSGPAHSVSSLPSHSHSVPSGPAHSISLPAFGTKSCGSKRHSITYIPSLAVAKPTGLPAAGGDDNDDSDVKPSSVSAFEHSHPSGLPVPEHEHPTPEVGEVCKKVTVTVIEIKELVAGDVEVISECPVLDYCSEI